MGTNWFSSGVIMAGIGIGILAFVSRLAVLFSLLVWVAATVALTLFRQALKGGRQFLS
jgi:hypothetical protein